MTKNKTIAENMIATGMAKRPRITIFFVCSFLIITMIYGGAILWRDIADGKFLKILAMTAFACFIGWQTYKPKQKTSD